MGEEPHWHCFQNLKSQFWFRDDYLKTWRDLNRRFRKAIAEGDQDFAKRFFRYAIWHLARRSHQTQLMPEPARAAAELLYEFAEELKNWIDRYEFMRTQYG